MTCKNKNNDSKKKIVCKKCECKYDENDNIVVTCTECEDGENKTITCYKFTHKYSLIYYGGKPVVYGIDFTPVELKQELAKPNNLVIIPHKAIDEEVEALDYNIIEDGRKYVLVEGK